MKNISIRLSFLFSIVSLCILIVLGIGTTSAPQQYAQTQNLNKKVMVIIFNPTVENKKLTQYENWGDPNTLTSEYITNMQQASHGRLQYTVAQKVEVNEFPKKVDGFSYTPSQYLQAAKDSANAHTPDEVDYNGIFNTYDICSKVNKGDIDEVWFFGGPWFGFYESRLAGQNAFNYNSPPLTGTSCNRPIPIMGFNYQRGPGEMIHDFGHRVEATMTYLYGGWEENRTTTNWDKFGLDKAQSPSFTTFGCGSVHFPPNTTTQSDEYHYDLPTSVASYCDSFDSYPNISATGNQISCSAWQCTDIGYYKWWLGHIPHNDGRGPDKLLNDWWIYLTDPATAVQDAGKSTNSSGGTPIPPGVSVPPPAPGNGICKTASFKGAYIADSKRHPKTSWNPGETYYVYGIFTNPLSCASASVPGCKFSKVLSDGRGNYLSQFICTAPQSPGDYPLMIQTAGGSFQNCCTQTSIQYSTLHVRNSTENKCEYFNFLSAKSDKTQIRPNDKYNITANFGEWTNCGTIGISGCVYTDAYTNEQGELLYHFVCTAPTKTGVYPLLLTTQSGTSQNCCVRQSKSFGSITVTNNPSQEITPTGTQNTSGQNLWVGVFLPGASDTAFISKKTISCNSLTSCSLSYQSPSQAGTYEVRLFSNTNRIVTSNPFTVTKNASTSGQVMTLNGDVDHNGCLDLRDFNFIMRAQQFQTTAEGTTVDTNHDGTVDTVDFGVWLNAIRNAPEDILCQK